MVSALKVGGRRLYELARAGEEVERAARPVHIDELVVEDLEDGAYPEATIRVECSSGTYIRTLAADLGAALGGCAHLGGLRRLRVGGFTLDDARTLDAIEADPDAAVRPPTEAMRDLEMVTVDAEQARAVAPRRHVRGARVARRTRRCRPVRDRRRRRRAPRGVRTPRRRRQARGGGRDGTGRREDLPGPGRDRARRRKRR